MDVLLSPLQGGWTPLLIAVYYGHAAIVGHLFTYPHIDYQAVRRG